MKAHAVASLKAEHSLQLLLDAAGLARSTFFYHLARLDRVDPQAELKAAITGAFNNARGRYGHRRIHTVLARQGWQVAKKTVLKLMRALGLVCKVRQKRKYNSWKGETGIVAPNLLQRDFTAARPNEKWVTDVTEFRLGDQKVYLSPIIDLFDRSVIAHTISRAPNLELTNESLTQAIKTLTAGEKPLVHSDQGFQYQHASWRKILQTVNATQSMSRKATCLDNAVVENFFGHLKEEAFHHDTFDNVDDLVTAITEYIHWYNTDRISTKLEGLSPVQYRTQALAA